MAASPKCPAVAEDRLNETGARRLTWTSPPPRGAENIFTCEGINLYPGTSLLQLTGQHQAFANHHTITRHHENQISTALPPCIPTRVTSSNDAGFTYPGTNELATSIPVVTWTSAVLVSLPSDCPRCLKRETSLRLVSLMAIRAGVTIAWPTHSSLMERTWAANKPLESRSRLVSEWI